MYMMSMVSLFILRTKEPNLERSFASPFYPVFPAIALIISAIAMFAIIWYHWQVSLIFFAGLGVAVAIFVMMGKHKVRLVEENMTAPIII
jgi:ethanolamine permease